MAEVQVRDLYKNFGKVVAVNHVDLHIKDGEFMCLLGPSGCGKTTTLRTIAGLESPTSGQVFIGQTDVTWLEPKDRDIAMVFESYALYPHMTVFDNIAYPLKVRKMQRTEVEQRVNRAAEILEIGHLLNRQPRQLSGGQKQRVAIGRAIVRQPAVYLMDEPISHLDAKLRAHMRGELKHLQKDLGTTTIYVTHDQLEAMAMADRVAVMERGVLQQLSTPEELYAHPVNMYVASFIGDPPINLLEGTLLTEGGTNYFSGKSFRVALPDRAFALAKERATTAEVVLGIRPEHFRVHREVTGHRCIPAVVFVSEPLGAEVIVDVKIGKQLCKVRASGETTVHMDEKLWLSFDERRFHIFDKATEKAII